MVPGLRWSDCCRFTLPRAKPSRCSASAGRPRANKKVDVRGVVREAKLHGSGCGNADPVLASGHFARIHMEAERNMEGVRALLGNCRCGKHQHDDGVEQSCDLEQRSVNLSLDFAPRPPWGQCMQDGLPLDCSPMRGASEVSGR
jgi:hypothetical protein